MVELHSIEVIAVPPNQGMELTVERMSEIERILRSGASARDDSVPPIETALKRARAMLGARMPPSYMEFCELGGLAELRFNHQILHPDEILENQSQLPPELLAFADNGCGDQYCWLASSLSLALGGTDKMSVHHAPIRTQ